jgi:hypothetical protein
MNQIIETKHQRINRYATAIKEAEQSAISADRFEDGGTCNLDTAVIDFKGWRESDVRQVMAVSGV